MSRGFTRANRQSAPAFGRLTNHDLLGFDQIATDLVLDAIAQGCTGRVSAKGHCILRNNTGDTASVPRNMTSPNRASQNAKAQVRRLLATHHPIGETDQDTLDTSSAAPRRMSIAQAFTDHSGPFSSWFDEQADGLPGDAEIEVSFGQDGTPAFRRIPPAADSQTLTPPEPEERPAREEEPNAPMNNRYETSSSPSEKEADHPAIVLQRVREALGTDPRVAELEAENQGLRAELEQQRGRADEAEGRIALLKEALGV